MIHPETMAVTAAHGPRPAGKPTECFYCKVTLGGVHANDCVLRQRTIVVRTTIEHIAVIPEHWTPEHFEFHRNEGSYCSANVLQEFAPIEMETTEVPCLCRAAEHRYVREATEEDERLLWFNPDRTEGVIPPAAKETP